MKTESQRPKGRKSAIPALNAAIETLNLAEKTSSIAPAKVVFGSVSILLVTIRDSAVDELDYVQVGLFCADVCRVLERGTDGKKLDELSQSVYGAINLLKLTVAEIQRELVKWGKRNVVSRHFHAKKDKATIATWRLDLDKILQVFNKELTIDTGAAVPVIRHDVTNTHAVVSGVRDVVANTRTIVSESHRNALKSSDTRGQEQRTHASAPGELPPPLSRSTHGTVSDTRHDVTRAIVSEVQRNVTSTQNMVSDIHRTVLKRQEVNDGRNLLTKTSTPGESPPLPPRTFFGRDELIEELVDLAEKSVPIALIGAGGIGKTSIALAVLNHDRIKQRFGHDRRFIRCDQFPASCAHLLRRISNVIGADIENPEDLTPLRTFLSSKKMLIVLDNAESVLDPQGANAQEIYNVAEELSRFDNICICITSRISTTPPDFKHIDVPTLSMDAARDTFYRIYDSNDRSKAINDILEQLDFHPLSVTLLATVTHQNKWDMDRLAREWEQRRTNVLQTQHNKSLAATVELSLASPMFRELGPDARALLGVIAFFPQGVNENNLNWLFPTISDRTDIFDKLCILSLTYRSNGFITMLAPLRDYLSPKDPRSSTLLCTTKDYYFARMSVHLDPNHPDFIKSQWITSEDVNVEHLLDVFTTIDASSDVVWDACVDFMIHLIWHKRRLIVLKSKIEGLPDDHSSKPECLFELSRLFDSVGNQMERKRLLAHVLELWRERENDYEVARILRHLSDANRLMVLPEEGIQLAKEALEIYERLGDTMEQAQCLIKLSWLLLSDKQFDGAEEAASNAIDLLQGTGHQHRICECHRILGHTYRSKGETEKAIHHLEVALGIASPFNWASALFWVHYLLAELFLDGDRFDDAHAHIERAKSYAVNSAYYLARVAQLEAQAWYGQCRLEEAMSGALHAVNAYEKLEAVTDVEVCRNFIQLIQMELDGLVASGQPALNPQGTE